MDGARRGLGPGDLAVLVFTLGYIAVFSVLFLQRGNLEFVGYVATMLGLIALVGLTLQLSGLTPALLWALSLWGLAHMAGGGVIVGGGVLYALVLVPLIGDAGAGSGELVLLKYDQVIHAYGFAVTALVLRHLLVRHHPGTRRGWTGYVFPALASMGLGATNEIIEFIAVLSVPDTNVGGYVNTALDLVMNALGAVGAMGIAAALGPRGAA